jgi:hypothetical protein
VGEQAFGCGHCWPSDADQAWEARRALSTVADLIDESHYGVSIRACPQCGQRFVDVFAETIDWAGGDDPQMSTVLPLTEAEAAELLRQGGGVAEAALDALGPQRRCLLHLFPPDPDGSRNAWRTGLVVGPHE